MNDIMNNVVNDTVNNTVDVVNNTANSSAPHDTSISPHDTNTEIQHSARAHARLNASSSHRWMMCPPSVKLSEQFVDKPSAYAEEGTYLHELCELKLHRYLGDMTPDLIEQQYVEHRDNDFYSDEAESVTDEYVAFCIETIEAVRSSCLDPLIMVEHRLEYSEYVPEGYGTGDLVIVADGVIKVINFKGGRGVRVDANRNSQVMLYDLGALLEFDPLYDIHTVRMTIVQPRLSNNSTYEITADDLIRWAEREVRPKALLAYEARASSVQANGADSARCATPANAASIICTLRSETSVSQICSPKRRPQTFCRSLRV